GRGRARRGPSAGGGDAGIGTGATRPSRGDGGDPASAPGHPGATRAADSRREVMTLQEMLESTPPGWAALVREAWEVCQGYDPPLSVSAAKQKWGELCIYISPRDWEQRPVAWAAARQRLVVIGATSQRTCEECSL